MSIRDSKKLCKEYFIKVFKGVIQCQHSQIQDNAL